MQQLARIHPYLVIRVYPYSIWLDVRQNHRAGMPKGMSVARIFLTRKKEIMGFEGETAVLIDNGQTQSYPCQ